MKRLNLNSPQDFMALAVRRKWWIAIPFLALSSAVILLTFMLPKGYVSQALILIQPRDVPSDLVRNLIAGTTEERLSIIYQTLLSRKTMINVYNEFKEVLPEYSNLNSIDDKVAKLQSQIGFRFSADNRSGSGQLPVTYFRISFQDPDPKTAQKIAQKLTDLFLAQNLDAREKQVNGSTSFFSVEVDKLAELLKDSDAKLKALKGSHRNELPSQMEPNLRNLESLRLSQNAISDQLVIMRTTLGQWQQQLVDIPKDLPKRVETIGTRTPPNPKVVDYRAKLAERKALLNRGFTENHPDIKAANLQLDRMKKDMTPEELALAEAKEDEGSDVPNSKAAETIPNPSYENLRLNIEQLNVQIGLKEKALKSTDADIDTIKKRLDNSPRTEMELADIERENQDLNKRYDEMRSKLSQTELSSTLEDKQKGEQFIIQDKPEVPFSATKPQKYVIAAGGTLISLLIGIAFGILVDIANQKMWTLSDVEAMLGTTVLVEIPSITTATDIVVARRRRLRNMASLTAVAAAYGVGLYFVYHHQGFVLRHLDPYIQRFYQ